MNWRIRLTSAKVEVGVEVEAELGNENLLSISDMPYRELINLFQRPTKHEYNKFRQITDYKLYT